MHALPLAVLVAVSAAPDQQPQLKIACPGLSGVKVSDREALFYSEHLAQQLAAAGAKVTSDREISAVLGLERKRQLLGCSESSSQCVTELAGALGVDALVVGDVARLQQRYQVNVKLISVASTTLLAAESERADTDEQLVDALTTIAGRLARRGAERLSRSLVPEGRMGSGTSHSGGPPILAIALAGGGVAAAGFGGYAYTQAGARYEDLLATTDPATALQLRNDGIFWRTATQLGLGVGAAALVGAAVTFFLGSAPAPAPEVAVSLSPGGGGVALSWSWP
ncbi:MAG TPA: FlgO family outer membrane protein [Myxococcales bacterium]|nr:FlgO family outer membrane protein [Myxococcales bacterium]